MDEKIKAGKPAEEKSYDELGNNIHLLSEALFDVNMAYDAGSWDLEERKLLVNTRKRLEDLHSKHSKIMAARAKADELGGEYTVIRLANGEYAPAKDAE